MKYLRRFILLLLTTSLLASSAFAFRSSIGFWRNLQVVDYIASLFNQGTSSGTTWDGTNNYLRLNQGSTLPSHVELDSSWAPEWSSLVGYYKLNEGAGTSGSGSVSDSSGNGNTGTPTNVTFGTSGKLNTAASFDGGSSYIDLGNPASMQITGQVTLSAWINVSAFPTTGNFGYVIGKGYNGANEGYFLRLSNPSGTPQLEAGSYSYTGNANYTAVSSIASWSSNNWYHVVGLYDGSNWVIYVNGLVQVTTPQAAGALSTPIGVSIGATNDGGISRYFNGVIDEAAIWSKALTSTEISAIYSRQSPYFGTTANSLELSSSWTPAWSNLVGYWKLNETAGSTNLLDSSPAGTNSGTVNGGVTLGAAGKLNTAASLNGMTGYISTATSFSNPNTISVSAWFNTTTTSGGPIVGLVNGSNFDRMLFMDNSGILYFGVYTSTYVKIATTNSYNDGNWHYAVGTLSASGMALYVDGSLVGTNAATNGFNYSGTWQIGDAPIASTGWGTVSSNYFYGTVDDVAMWNTAISASAVASIYQHQFSKYAGTFTSRIMDGLAAAANWGALAWTPTLPFFKELPDGGSSESSTSYSAQSAGLMSGNVGLWHFDETAFGTAPSGTDFADKSGSANHLTHVNGVVPGVAGKLGNAASFDGSAGKVNLTNPITFGGTF
jgi:hypothetical protein